MMIDNIKGLFTAYDAVIEADPSNLTTVDIALPIDKASIEKRKTMINM